LDLARRSAEDCTAQELSGALSVQPTSQLFKGCMGDLVVQSIGTLSRGIEVGFQLRRERINLFLPAINGDSIKVEALTPHCFLELLDFARLVRMCPYARMARSGMRLIFVLR
jgi:hypothetical protein